jgi:hypothetical protein
MVDWKVYMLAYDPVRIVSCSPVIDGHEVKVSRNVLDRTRDEVRYRGIFGDVLEIDGEFYMCPSAANRLRESHGNPAQCTRWTNKKNAVVGLTPVLCLDLIVRVVSFL